MPGRSRGLGLQPQPGLQPRARLQPQAAVHLPDHLQQAEVTECAGGCGASRASWNGPGTTGSSESFRKPALPWGGGGVTGGNALSPTLIRSLTFHRMHRPQAARRHTRGHTAAAVRAGRHAPRCALQSGSALSVERCVWSDVMRAERCNARRAVRCAVHRRSDARGAVRVERCARFLARIMPH